MTHKKRKKKRKFILFLFLEPKMFLFLEPLQAQSHTLQGRTRNTHFDCTSTQTDVD